jgi:hypothetical protein
MRTQVDTTQRKKTEANNFLRNQVKTLCKEDSWLQNDNQEIEKKPLVQKLESGPAKGTQGPQSQNQGGGRQRGWIWPMSKRQKQNQ